MTFHIQHESGKWYASHGRTPHVEFAHASSYASYAKAQQAAEILTKYANRGYYGAVAAVGFPQRG